MAKTHTPIEPEPLIYPKMRPFHLKQNAHDFMPFYERYVVKRKRIHHPIPLYLFLPMSLYTLLHVRKMQRITIGIGQPQQL
mmetsp:Transcript_41588/g.42212  ORF Transcript_41588/g.42212 Transcript_41588/m.42212 type:complete len:81 (-) Transcript_41588:304-546(-)